MKWVVYPRIDEHRAQRLGAASDGEVVNAETEAEALAQIADADAFFGKITPDLLRAARRLRWIQCPTASLEHYLFPELVRHPVVLTNMRGIFSDVIADHVMGFVLCFARNLHTYVRRQIAGAWAPCGCEEYRPDYLGGAGVATPVDCAAIHLADATMGIVGLGAIGREVARRADAFGMQILAVDAESETPKRRDCRPLPASLTEIWDPSRLHDLLAASDFVCLTVPHTPLTFKLFRTPQFERMKRSAFLINVGRGAVVDLDDLVRALDAGEIAGAALDVFETEPLPAGHPLWARENVIITPHVAGASPRVAERHLEVLLENVRRFRAGRSLLNVVDKERWY